jgi:hypothetical protein
LTDWAAIGAVATVATVLTGYLQYRATKAASAHDPKLAVGSVPTLSYKLNSGRALYPFPDGWMVEIPDERWTLHQRIMSDLKDYGFCVVDLCNKNKFVIANVVIELRGWHIWSARVEDTKSLSPNAVQIALEPGRIVITISELPAGEQIKVSAVCGGGFHGAMSVLNASVKLERKGLWDA